MGNKDGAMGPRTDPSKAIASILGESILITLLNKFDSIFLLNLWYVESKVEPLEIGYAARLQSKLSDISSDTGSSSYSSSLEELKKYLDILPISSSIAIGGILASDRGKLDTQGTVLWNACTRLMRRAGGYMQEEEGGLEREEQSLFLCYVKTFAFLLLESGCAGRKGFDTGNYPLETSFL